MAIKDENGGKPWYEWERPLKMAEPWALEEAKRRLEREIGFYIFVQYEFYKQWFALKKYANRNGIEIIGDMPIYCAYDSVEAWLHPELFEFDGEKRPITPSRDVLPISTPKRVSCGEIPYTTGRLCRQTATTGG